MRLLVSLFLFFCSSSAFSATYSWLGNSVSGPSPAYVCDKISKSVIRPTGEPYTLIRVSETRFDCTYNWWGNDAQTFKPSATVEILRGGDSCETDAVYNDQSGECEINECLDTAGDPAYHSSTTGVTRSLATDPWPPGPVTGSPTMCSGSCQYALAQSTTVQCGYLKNGDPLIQYCLFKYSGTGQSCQPGDPAQNNGSTASVPPTDPNDPTDPANNCGPTHVWSGTTCVAILEPDPADPTDPGTGGTDPGTGGGGPGTGGGDPGTGGGDGSGGTGGGDAGGDDQSTVEGEGCKAILECEGDAIQCAMLRTTKAQRCNWDLTSEVEDDIIDSFQGDEYELGERTIDLSAGFTAGLTDARFFPAACPQPVHFTVRGKSYALEWTYVCDFASGLSSIIVAMAAVFFGLYVGRGLGGE